MPLDTPAKIRRESGGALDPAAEKVDIHSSMPPEHPHIIFDPMRSSYFRPFTDHGFVHLGYPEPFGETDLEASTSGRATHPPPAPEVRRMLMMMPAVARQAARAINEPTLARPPKTENTVFETGRRLRQAERRAMRRKRASAMPKTAKRQEAGERPRNGHDRDDRTLRSPSRVYCRCWRRRLAGISHDITVLQANTLIYTIMYKCYL